MSHENSGFRSRSERQKEEALSCRYGRIGIPAVAAAKTVQNCGSRDERPATVVLTPTQRIKQ